MSTTRTLVPTRQRTRVRGAGPASAGVAEAGCAWPSESSNPPNGESSTRWTLVDLDRYEVRRGDAIVGYVDVVGPVFVALVGMRYDRATEVAQTLTFLTAIAVVAAVADD